MIRKPDGEIGIIVFYVFLNKKTAYIIYVYINNKKKTLALFNSVFIYTFSDFRTICV